MSVLSGRPGRITDTTTPGGELVFTIMAAIAQMERRLIQERTLAGLEAARARGRVGGRPRSLTDDQVAEARRMREDGRPVAEIAALFRVARSTLAGYLTPTPVS
ncbi:recombinase family protein [Georgenia yuyongxinii]|nr:recombinase family protein [Georgenia yuyongxinii]